MAAQPNAEAPENLMTFGRFGVLVGTFQTDDCI